MDVSALDTWLRTFTRLRVNVHGVTTAVYVGPVHKGRKTCLFVHGINGDYHAFAPLAYELKDACNSIFVELPGHGESAIPKDGSGIELFGAWAQSLNATLRRNGRAADVVVGHSFGAYIAQETNVPSIVLLNPPFLVTSFSRNGSRMMRLFYPLIGRLYHSYGAMIWRGKWLLHAKTPEAVERMKWSARQTSYSRAQIAFQARLGDETARASVMDIAKIRSHTTVAVVTGQFDRVVNGACVTNRELPEASFLSLPTNHVSIFEKPAEVAAFIRETCL